jgi:uncharacterized protein (DUF4415 family)
MSRLATAPVRPGPYGGKAFGGDGFLRSLATAPLGRGPREVEAFRLDGFLGRSMDPYELSRNLADSSRSYERHVLKGPVRGRAMKDEYDFRRGKRGAALSAPPGKTRITIRLDQDILEWFRTRAHAAGGGNYQTMINDALRAYMNDEVEPLEDTLRRVVREELGHRAG